MTGMFRSVVRLTTEAQVWATLADEYERGHSDMVSLHAICISLSGLGVMGATTPMLDALCRTRLKVRFEPKQPPWWAFWRPLVDTTYYWPPKETKPRAAACDALFYEAIEDAARACDDRDREREKEATHA